MNPKKLKIVIYSGQMSIHSSGRQLTLLLESDLVALENKDNLKITFVLQKVLYVLVGGIQEGAESFYSRDVGSFSGIRQRLSSKPFCVPMMTDNYIEPRGQLLLTPLPH